MVGKKIKMVVSCVDVACQDRHGQRPGLGFFVSHFYLIEESWINAVKMNNWNHLCIPEYVVITALISGMGFNSCISYYYVLL